MKKAKISELKNNLSRYLAFVRRGGTVRVFDRDLAIAEIVPIHRRPPLGEDAHRVLEELERTGVLRRGTGTLPKDFLTRKLPRSKKSVVDALIEDRRDGR